MGAPGCSPECLSKKSFRHHEVGLLTLNMQTFDVRAAPDQQLIVYDASPGTSSADALTLLGSIAATGNRPRHFDATR